MDKIKVTAETAAASAQILGILPDIPKALSAIGPLAGAAADQAVSGAMDKASGAVNQAKDAANAAKDAAGQ